MTEIAGNAPQTPPTPRRSKKSPFVQRLEYGLYRGLVRVIGLLSARGVERWGARLGNFASRALSRRTRLAVANVAKTFPEKGEAECQEIVLACWRHFARTLLQYLWTRQESMEEMADRFDLPPLTPFEEARALNRGVIVVTPHLGVWEFGIALLNEVDAEVTTVARVLDNELIERDLFSARKRSRIHLVDRRRAARSLVRTIENKGVVILLPDQAVKPREGILVPFLGRDAWTTTAPAKLALRYGTPILNVYILPDGDRFRIEFDEAIIPDRLPETERTVEALTRRMNDLISVRIRRDPHLWLWMHDRWKWTESQPKRGR